MDQKSEYKDYFRTQRGATFSEKDIADHEKWFHNQWRFIKSRLRITPSQQVLEVGSGLGGFYHMLGEPPGYVGLELDSDAARFANEHFNTDRFLNESIEEYRPDREFDLVFAFELLEHLSDPLGSIEKVYSALKYGGFFCGTSAYPCKKYILADPTHLFVLHPENWKRLLEHAGFKGIELYARSFVVPYLWRFDKRLNLTVPFYLPFKSIVSGTLIIAKKPDGAGIRPG